MGRIRRRGVAPAPKNTKEPGKGRFMKAICTLLLMLLAPPLVRADDAGAPHGRLPDTVVPVSYRLELDVDPRRADFTGEAEIAVTVREPTATIWLHGLGLKVAAVSAETATGRRSGRYQEVEHDFGVARVVFSAPLPAGRALLRFRYRAPFQQTAQGLYRTRVGNDWYAFSQFEATDARRMFPGFDEPRFKTPFDVAVVTHGGDLAVGNMPESRSTPVAGGGIRHEYRTTPPLPTYLLAVAVGPLDIASGPPIAASAVRAEPLPLRIVGTRGKAARFAFALRETPRLVTALEDYLGIAFPYPKLDLIASPIHGGAMENAGAIIFAESLLAFDDTPTARQQGAFAGVTAHELAHQWFGDLVTPAWWDDIWLNESFAEWLGSKIADRWQPGLGIDREQLDQTLTAMSTDALSAGRPVRQPITDNAQIGTTFDEITYQKGAGVIGMVESYLGPERFRRGVQLHLARHPHGVATADEFFAAMADASGDPALIDAFRSFIDQAGVPLLHVARAPDGSLTIEQSRYRPLGPTTAGSELWHVPFCVNVYGSGEPTRVCTLLSERHGTLALPAAARTGTVFPNAAGAGYYRFTIDQALLRQLLAIAPELPAREALALADSVGAAFDAGQLSFADLYETARVLARHPDTTAKLVLGYRLEDLHDRLATAAERPLLEHALVDLYGQRLRALGYDPAPGRYSADPASLQLERRYLIGLVGLGGRDPAVRRELASLAVASAADPSKVDPLIRWRVWAVGVQEQGAAMLAPLTAHVNGTDAQLRQDATIALAHAETPALLEKMRAVILDPKQDMNAALQILGREVANPEIRDDTWRWLALHREAVIGRVPAMFQGFLADLGAGFCTAAGRQQFNDVLGTRLRGVSGGEIAVDRTLERIDDCMALRSAVGGAVEATLRTPAQGPAQGPARAP
jgi:hypothetical protein